MDGTELTEELVKKMKGRGPLTIPEILQDLSALGVQTLGERDLLWPGNVVVWQDTTEEAIAAIIALVNDPRSGFGRVSQMSVMNYAYEGHVLNYPPATEAGIKKGYKKWHWWPMEIAIR